MSDRIKANARPMTDEEMRDIRGGSDAGNKINNFLDSKLARAVGPTLGRIVENHGAEGLRGLGIPWGVFSGPGLKLLLLGGGTIATILGLKYVAKNTLVENLPKRALEAAPFVATGLLAGFAARHYAPSEKIKKVGKYATVGLIGTGTYILFLKDAFAGSPKKTNIKIGPGVPVALDKSEKAKAHAAPLSIELQGPGVFQNKSGAICVGFPVKLTNTSKIPREVRLVLNSFNVEGKYYVERPRNILDSAADYAVKGMMYLTKTKAGERVTVPPEQTVTYKIIMKERDVKALMAQEGRTFIKAYGYVSPFTEPLVESKELDLESYYGVAPEETP